jgi:hypothetical protein
MTANFTAGCLYGIPCRFSAPGGYPFPGSRLATLISLTLDQSAIQPATEPLFAEANGSGATNASIPTDSGAGNLNRAEAGQIAEAESAGRAIYSGSPSGGRPQPGGARR